MVIALSALLLGGMQMATPLHVQVEWDGQRCLIRVDGKTVENEKNR